MQFRISSLQSRHHSRLMEISPQGNVQDSRINPPLPTESVSWKDALPYLCSINDIQERNTIGSDLFVFLPDSACAALSSCVYWDFEQVSARFWFLILWLIHLLIVTSLLSSRQVPIRLFIILNFSVSNSVHHQHHVYFHNQFLFQNFTVLSLLLPSVYWDFVKSQSSDPRQGTHQMQH